jgi:hypothetical protein
MKLSQLFQVSYKLNISDIACKDVEKQIHSSNQGGNGLEITLNTFTTNWEIFQR